MTTRRAAASSPSADGATGRARRARLVRAARRAGGASSSRTTASTSRSASPATPGELTNKLVLTQDDPIGDVAFGVDNAFASRALDEGVFAAGRRDAAGGRGRLRARRATTTARWCRSTTATCASTSTTPSSPTRGSPRRETFEDLTEPAYGTSSSPRRPRRAVPGLAFLLATIAEYGDDVAGVLGAADGQRHPDREQLDRRLPGRLHPGRRRGRPADRDVLRLEPGVHRRRGQRRRARRSALLDTCFLQVEYAGVLAGAANPEGARAGASSGWSAPRCRRRCPTACTSSRSPTASSCPRRGRRFAERPTDPQAVDPAEVAEQRDAWLQEWTDITTR